MARALVLLASTASALSLSSLQGVDAPKLRIGDNALGVRGLIATEDIKQGEQLIAARAWNRIPRAPRDPRRLCAVGPAGHQAVLPSPGVVRAVANDLQMRVLQEGIADIRDCAGMRRHVAAKPARRKLRRSSTTLGQTLGCRRHGAISAIPAALLPS